MERRARWRPSNFTPPTTPLRVVNALGTDGGSATLYLYDAIDEWGGEWGVSASEFVTALNGIQASRIDLRLNSPGGSVWEATAMRAALVAHPAEVHVYVDGLAASAASILATVGDRVIMAPGSQQMIHCASSLAIGNADDMRTTADLLDKVDGDIAGFYLQRSGQGTAESWLDAMKRETWMTADEAVAAGLADEVSAFGGPKREDEPAEQAVAASADRWITAAWRYAGRENAPAPALPTDAARPAAQLAACCTGTCSPSPTPDDPAPQRTAEHPAPVPPAAGPETSAAEAVPGWEGSVGPFPRQYGDPHVYARDVQSGAGNCVCGAAPTDDLHVYVPALSPAPDAPETSATEAEAPPTAELPTAAVSLSELLCSAIREGVTL